MTRARRFLAAARRTDAARTLHPLAACLLLLAAGCGPPADAAGDRTEGAARSSAERGPESGPSLQSGRSLEGRIALVTGSTSGLGREVARRLARSGAHVLVHGRNEERGRALVDEIDEETPGSARFHRADFASLDEVRELAAAVLRDHDHLDLLVNNAGVWLEPSDGRVLSEDGHELHFQVNYLAHYLLTDLLLPLLESTGTDDVPARIVNVASVAQRAIDFDDVMLEEGYDDGRGYAQSKLAMVMHAFALAEELEGAPVLVNAVHPATMMDTRMVLSRGARPRASVEEGVEAVLHLVESPDAGSGRYFDGTTPERAHEQAYDAAARDRLMRLSEELAGG